MPAPERPSKELLKIREMREFLEFELDKSEAGDVTLKPTKRTQGFEKDAYQAHELRKEIEPWLTALFQSEHFSLLTGAGLTNAVHHRVTGNLPGGFSNRPYAVFDEQIQAEAKRSAQAVGRGNPNPEDQLRTALKIADGLRILTHGEADEEPWKSLKTNHSTLEADITEAIKALVKGVLSSERGITSQSEKREEALRFLVSFLMSFASRTGTRDRLHIFTTNYDRLIEFGAELAGIRLIDRFIGSLTPLFRASRLDVDLHYNPPGIRGDPHYLEGVARFTKLHGSLDWIDDDREVRRVALPFGVEDYSPYIPQGVQNLLIYPKDAKDRETADYPYVELHRDFAAALCRPNSVLVTYGYSFGDDHINRVIRDMLTIPSTHLVILNHADTGKRLTRFYTDSKRTAQISLLIGKHFGDLGNLVDYYLPKPAIDRASIRMAELLRARGLGEKPLPESSRKQETGDAGTQGASTIEGTP
jgi:hypothetical protein